MSDDHDLRNLFAETAATTRDEAFADRVARAATGRRFPLVHVLARAARPLAFVAVVATLALAAAVALQAVPYGGLILAAGAVTASILIRRRLA